MRTPPQKPSFRAAAATRAEKGPGMAPEKNPMRDPRMRARMLDARRWRWAFGSSPQ